MLRGTIYKITSSATPKIYIGSTIQPLHIRFLRHKYSFKNNKSCTSKLILQYEDANIEELHILECESIKELRAKEQEFITLHKNVAVNISGTKNSQSKEYKKKYLKENQKEYQKEYRSTEEYKVKRNTQVQCECCDKTYTRSNKSAHMKKYHL
jgi:hypothetical protein